MTEITEMIEGLIRNYEVAKGANVLMSEIKVIGKCPHCGAEIKKSDCEKVMVMTWDEQASEVSSQAKIVPIRISYESGGKRLTKAPDSHDLEVIEKIAKMNCQTKESVI